MATKQIVELIDDTDGSLATETVRFALDRESYEIDLSEANARALRAGLSEFIGAARRIQAIKQGTRTRAHRADTATIRQWAKLRGITLQERGRIPAEIIAQYEASKRAVPVVTESPTERATVTLPAVGGTSPDSTAPGPEAPSQSRTEPPEPPAPEPTTEPPADTSTEPGNGNRNAVIRAWAKVQGIKINDRGKIPAAIVEEYDARHGGAVA